MRKSEMRIMVYISKHQRSHQQALVARSVEQKRITKFERMKYGFDGNLVVQNSFQYTQTINIRDVLTTTSNIYDGCFCEKS